VSQEPTPSTLPMKLLNPAIEMTDVKYIKLEK
jgi:hypothetical protein